MVAHQLDELGCCILPLELSCRVVVVSGDRSQKPIRDFECFSQVPINVALAHSKSASPLNVVEDVT